MQAIVFVYYLSNALKHITFISVFFPLVFMAGFNTAIIVMSFLFGEEQGFPCNRNCVERREYSRFFWEYLQSVWVGVALLPLHLIWDFQQEVSFSLNLNPEEVINTYKWFANEYIIRVMAIIGLLVYIGLCLMKV